MRFSNRLPLSKRAECPIRRHRAESAAARYGYGSDSRALWFDTSGRRVGGFAAARVTDEEKAKSVVCAARIAGRDNGFEVEAKGPFATRWRLDVRRAVRTRVGRAVRTAAAVVRDA